ncbi:unnamed protein product [Brachionus calyciflorus]|uniref:Uncharacterized protein n=1 Tax=Brachionus calyciflorus TaxID=104777 RepID=A0A814FVI1_9BILA|nr:unnamed protein product [Brachionus calyciflorus]
MDSETFYLIHFAFDNTFIVIDFEDLNGIIKNNQVKMKWDDVWDNGLIVYEGTEEKCYQKSKKLCPSSTDLRSSGDEDSEAKNKKQKRDLSNGDNAYTKEISKLNRLQKIHHNISTPINKQFSTYISPSTPRCSRDPIDSSPSSPVSQPSRLNSNGISSPEHLDDTNTELPTKNMRMYDGQNLLEIKGDVLNKYVIAVMQTLFTKDELNDGLIKTDNSRSRREKLD